MSPFVYKNKLIRTLAQFIFNSGIAQKGLGGETTPPSFSAVKNIFWWRGGISVFSHGSILWRWSVNRPGSIKITIFFFRPFGHLLLDISEHTHTLTQLL